MMSRHDLHAEREWQQQMSERNERSRRIKMRRRKIPVDDHEETLLLLFVVGWNALPTVAHHRRLAQPGVIALSPKASHRLTSVTDS